ncbi:MAG: SAM-dependent methyltransferase [Comamonadaceae bacterium]|nr:SAM-dependent methyltransferase [Comamonadaceae bacterium]
MRWQSAAQDVGADDTEPRSPCRGRATSLPERALDLPQPDADERAHGARAGRGASRDEIARAGGWIPLRALHAARALRAGPRLLRRGRAQVRRRRRLRHRARGRRRCSARRSRRRSRAILRGLGGGDVLELGAGVGRAGGATCWASSSGAARCRARYAILEVSADLRERQRATLARDVPQLVERVEWLDALPEALRRRDRRQRGARRACRCTCSCARTARCARARRRPASGEAARVEDRPHRRRGGCAALGAGDA